MRTLRGALLLALVAGLLAGPARAADPLKIGFITTLSGPHGVIGKHMKDSVELALDHLGRKIGGLDVEMIYGDDQLKPDVGVQLADEMLKKHKVDFVSRHHLVERDDGGRADGDRRGQDHGRHQRRRRTSSPASSATSSTSPPRGRTTRRPRRWASTCRTAGVNDVYVMAPNYAGRQGHGHGLQALLQGPHRRRGLHQARPAGLPGRDHRSCARRTRRRCSSSIRAAWASSS